MMFNKNVMVNEAKEIREFIKKNKRLPNSATMKDRDGKEQKLDKNQYLGLFKNQAQFFQTNGRLPNYTSLLYSSSTSFNGQKQPNGWTCGSTSLSNAATQVFKYVTEKECRAACKTNKDGTIPDNLIRGAKILGLEVKPISRTFNNVRQVINTGGSVIGHIQTKPATCLKYDGDFGHYLVIYGTTEDYNFKLYDPTRGQKTCNANIIIKATGGRDIKFYSVN